MIELKKINKKYDEHILFENFSLKIKQGDFISIIGESGKGKTTLLNMIGLLEPIDSGEIIIDNDKNPRYKKIQMIQRYKFGYLFQNFALIDNETVEKNLLIALKYRKNINKKEEMKKALSDVGLSNCEKKKIFEMSGGEQQRVALARLMLKQSNIILADEPTGNLDKTNRDIVFNILKRLNADGKTVIYVTHDTELAELANRSIAL